MLQKAFLPSFTPYNDTNKGKREMACVPRPQPLMRGGHPGPLKSNGQSSICKHLDYSTHFWLFLFNMTYRESILLPNNNFLDFTLELIFSTSCINIKKKKNLILNIRTLFPLTVSIGYHTTIVITKINRTTEWRVVKGTARPIHTL